MTTTMKKNERRDLQTDVKLLLECLEYQKNDVHATKQAFVTLSTILNDSIEAKEEFQEAGGLEQVLLIVTTSKVHEVVEAGLYCLGSAVEKNVYSQKLLTNASVFSFLHGILSSSHRGASVRKKQTAAYLILCLVTNNGFGQNLARQSSCLQDILNVVRSVFLKTGRMNLMSFDTDVESMHDLWTSLLSAACACINNPMNEENQRICASLLPLMFNLLSCQKDCQIVRPILSFIGHTVASHSCNQDRVRKCGGLEILVHKLKSLQAWIENDSDANYKETAVQLLFTLDACISDNDLSSKKFGELDGINIVIHILNNSTLDVSDRTQAILTLAHAIDAYDGNEQYIKKGDGIPVLIQQLTATNDEELNKIVKYLLHMCVSKDDNIDSAGKQDQSYVSQMEAMKRFGDIQMLEKISELDNKLKSLQSKTSIDDSFDDDRAMSKFSKRYRMVYAGHLDDTTSTHNSRRSSHCVKDASETPREKSLLQQLIKEKVEKERLEKLNQGLQETLIRNQTERFQHHKDLTTSDLDESIMSGFDSDTNMSSHSRSRNNSTSRMHHDLANRSCRNRTNGNAATRMHTDSARHTGEPEYSNHMNVQPSQQFNNGFNNDHRNAMISSAHQDENIPLAYGMNSANQSENWPDNVSNKSDILRNNQGDQRTVVYQGRDLMINQANQRSKSNVDLISKENIPGSFRPNTHHTSTGTDKFDLNQSEVYYATPWSMSNPNSAKEQRKNNDSSTNTSHNGSVNSVTQSVTNKGDARPSLCDTNRQKTTSTTINRNAEIQCGTPFVLFTDQQEKIDSGNAASSCTSDSEAQTDFVNKPNFKTPLIVKKNTKTCDVQTKTSENLMKSTNIKPCSIQLEKCEQNVKPTEKTTQNLKNGPSNHQKNSSCSPMSQKSGAFFIKPIARAPKGKIRVTPLLGSSSDHGKCSSVRSMPSSVKSHKSQISDLVSEFDLNLLNNAQEKQQNSSSNSKQMSSNVRQQSLNVKQQYTTPVNVVKSQNNVRRIDKVVEPRHGNAADRWQVHTSTPNRKSIQPVRPAFSDCGTRRFGFNSSSAVKSPQYNRRRSIDDSGIHSPLGELNVMPWGSPIDSDIDGFRSSSDVSEDEIKKPNINPTVLRSSKKKKNTTGSCPGCVAPYVGEIELNSRTYNIVMETNPYTCDMHRKQRQIERNYINQQRKKMKLRSMPKGRILGVEPKSKRSKTCNLRSSSHNLRSNRNKENQFEFLTDTEAEISPVSADDDCNMNLSMTKSQKKRRQRVPYTLEEEANIIEGVEKLGKYWNQILVTYKFHPSRTNVDLMWKYKRMRAASNPGNASTCKSVQSRAHRPFSMCEERRLRRGIMKFGYNWKTILKSFTFSEGRTTEDLRNRWRTIHGQT